MSIKVVEQSTSEYYDELDLLFECIRPLLDEGYTYRNALKKVGRITKDTSLSRSTPRWFRDLRVIGEVQGYRYKDYI